MRVMIILPTRYEPPWSEGVKNLSEKTMKFLESKGDDICVASLSGIFSNKDGWIEVDKSFSTTLSKSAQLSLIQTARKAAQFFNPDVMLLFTSATSSLGLKTSLIRKLIGKPLVIYVSGLRPPILGFNKFLSVDKVLVGSPFLQKYFPDSTFIPPFLPNTFMRDRSVPVTKTSSTIKTFLFLGAWENGRGLEDLIEAIAIAYRQVPLRLIVGLNGHIGKDATQFAEYIRSRQLEEVIDVRGTVNAQDVYEEADVVVIPRNKPFRMAFPVRIIEALYMRKPLIVTKMCDMDQLITGCGLGVEPNCPEQMAEAIITLASDEVLYHECVENCVSKADEYHSTRSLERLYGELSNACSSL